MDITFHFSPEIAFQMAALIFAGLAATRRRK